MSNPPTVTLPAVGGIKPVSIRMVVDLPAPLGPRNPSTSPRSTENETPSTARFVPKNFAKFSTLIILTRTSGGNSASGRRCKQVFSAKIGAEPRQSPLNRYGEFDISAKKRSKKSRQRTRYRQKALTRTVFGGPQSPVVVPVIDARPKIEPDARAVIRRPIIHRRSVRRIHIIRRTRRRVFRRLLVHVEINALRNAI